MSPVDKNTCSTSGCNLSVTDKSFSCACCKQKFCFGCTTTIQQLAEILVPDKEALKNEVDNREDWLHQIENGLEAESEGRGAPKKLPRAIWEEHETFKKRVEEYCA